jgi:hypothetical protein
MHHSAGLPAETACYRLEYLQLSNLQTAALPVQPPLERQTALVAQHYLYLAV